jgi:23S rRNA (cytosine1962-C5)-methyltransferase
LKSIRLRAGKERSLLRRHPWVFEGSIERGRADAGETVRVEAHDGAFLAWGAYSPSSAIKVRAWSFDEAERIDHAFIKRRVARALEHRARLAIPSNGLRLVHGEADGLPGCVVDRYGEVLCGQFLAAGAERWREAIADALLAATGCTRFYERSDSGVRALEGLPERRGWLRGDGPTGLRIEEHGWQLGVDLHAGHKTGYYLDQRDNRALLAAWVKQHGIERVLNCFSYAGGFSVAALAGGAREVISVDSSAPALQQALDNVGFNGLDPHRHHIVDADVNAHLRTLLKAGEAFDAIVLDPPKFAPSAAHAVRAARAYKDINRLALKLLAPGGLLLSFSCSGGIGIELFQKIVAGAAADAGVDATIVRRLEAAPDHPATLQFPEGEYLKGLAVVRR